jgi:ferredoxin
VDSPFEILGIDPDANETEIVRAYRQRVKEAHPDHGGSAREFQRVKAAYEAAQAGRTDGVLDTESEAESEPTPEGTTVEFLNYETLDDHGWELDDEDLFEKAAAADLDPADYGKILVQPHEHLLEAAENRGFSWPFACRGGACANCAVAVVEGEMEMPSNHVLSPEMIDRGFGLSCISGPITDEMKVVFNIKHLPGLDELRLPAQRFNRARPTD